MQYNEEKIKALEGKRVKILTQSNRIVEGILHNYDMEYVEVKNEPTSKVGSYIHKCNIIRMIEVIKM